MAKLHVSLLLDETGSMEDVKEETISGYNKYIKSLDGVFFTMTKFDSSAIQVVHDAVPIKKVPRLTEDTYVPGAMTPLLDAIGTTIKAMGKKKKVLFVVFTDGYENASKEMTKEDVKSLIKDRKKRGWQFVFLGADMDGITEAGAMGFPTAALAAYTPGTEVKTMHTLSAVTRSWTASGGAQDIDWKKSEASTN